MKALKIITLLLCCRLAWIWLDQCGANLGMGESLPFCIECSGITTFFRLLLLALAAYMISRILGSAPSPMQVYNRDLPYGRTFQIHWHRIILLLLVLGYPLWVAWVDANTFIPGPNRVPLLDLSCRHSGFKGSLLWAIEMICVVWTLRILHRS